MPNRLIKCSRCGRYHEMDEDGVFIESDSCAQERNDEAKADLRREREEEKHGKD